MKRSIVLVSLLLVLAAPAVQAEGYFSLLWTDRPVCLLLADCTEQWRLRVRYNLEWQPPVSYAPALFTDADVLLRGASDEDGHFIPLHSWMGGGVRWHFDGISLSAGGTSGHYFDRGSTGPDWGPGFERPAAVYNYVDARWTW